MRGGLAACMHAAAGRRMRRPDQPDTIRAVAYKMLGYVVWQGAKWYLRRRYRGAGRKVMIGGAAAAALAAAAGAIVAQRGSDSE